MTCIIAALRPSVLPHGWVVALLRCNLTYTLGAFAHCCIAAYYIDCRSGCAAGSSMADGVLSKQACVAGAGSCRAWQAPGERPGGAEGGQRRGSGVCSVGGLPEADMHCAGTLARMSCSSLYWQCDAVVNFNAKNWQTIVLKSASWDRQKLAANKILAQLSAKGLSYPCQTSRHLPPTNWQLRVNQSCILPDTIPFRRCNSSLKLR
jgi:hypothetical protein